MIAAEMMEMPQRRKSFLLMDRLFKAKTPCLVMKGKCRECGRLAGEEVVARAASAKDGQAKDAMTR
jgi:hypothetical protein